MATIKDIAQKAGVSVSCVSRAINGYPDIKDSTRQRILQIVDEMHYYPKASARHLVTNRTQTIGLIFETHDQSGFGHPFISKILTAFFQKVGEHGYDLLMFTNSRNPFDTWGLEDRVKYRDVDGIFLIGRPPNFEKLLQLGIPITGLDFTLTGKSASSVMSDNRQGVQELIKQLYDKGYRRFGFAYGPLNLLPAMERLQGFHSGLWEVGLSSTPQWIVYGNFTYEGGKDAAKQFLTLTNRPEVVLFSSDLSAIGAMQIFQEYGLNIPQDIAVTGFDDVDAATFAYPSLTTIRQDMEQLGQAAATMLLNLMENQVNSPQHLAIPTTIVWRNSTVRTSLSTLREGR